MWQLGFGAMHQNGYFKREEIPLKNIETYKALIKYYNNQDVYHSCYYYDYNNDNEKVLLGHFYLDFDSNLEEDFLLLKEDVIDVCERIKDAFKLSNEHFKLYFSGSKGFHLIVPYYNLGFTKQVKLNEAYRKLALYYKKYSSFIDTKIYDDRRVFRIPNSINTKTHLYKVLLDYEAFPLMTLDDILEIAKAPVPMVLSPCVSFVQYEKNRDTAKSLISIIEKEEAAQYKMQRKNFKKAAIPDDCIFPCVDRMLSEVHSQGERNEKLIIIASHLLQKQIDKEEVIDFLLDWNDTHNEPPLKDKEVIVTVNSAANQVQQGKGYGCTALSRLGYCDFKCEYGSRKDE